MKIRLMVIAAATCIAVPLAMLPLALAIDRATFVCVIAGATIGGLMLWTWWPILLLVPAIALATALSLRSSHFCLYAGDMSAQWRQDSDWVIWSYLCLRAIQLSLAAVVGILLVQTSWSWKVYIPWAIICLVVVLWLANRRFENSR